MRPDARLVWATKGLEAETGRLLQDVAREALGDQIPLAVISGPTFAKELAAGLPTAISLASTDQTFADDLQQLLHCGKSFRVFGVLVSSLFAVVTTAASCGAVIAMHDSFTALGGMVPMWLMQIGEVVFGGVGSGLYGMMLFVLLAVFIAGLMIGRTPEYLGKKIDVREMKLTALAILVTPTLVLMGAALAMMTDAGRSAMLNPGPHGFSEVLYAVSSAANNNGSAFAGLSANSPFWNCLSKPF